MIMAILVGNLVGIISYSIMRLFPITIPIFLVVLIVLFVYVLKLKV